MFTIEIRIRLAILLTLATTVGVRGTAYAQSTSSDIVEPTKDAPTSEAKTASPDSAARYSLPSQLRPVTIGNVVRVDGEAAAFNDPNGNLDVAIATGLTASYQVNRDWAPMIRLGFVRNNAPGAALDGSSFANPMIGATYARNVGGYKLALFGATTIPIGTGAGDDRVVPAARTNVAAITARPADSAMFAVNYMTEIVGADFAYVGHGFTAQAEATLLEFVRVRGSDSPAATDALRTKASVGLHVGYFLGSHFSLGADVSYQRWLSHPTTVNAATGADVPLPDANMHVLTLAAGPRLHYALSDQTWIHPGLSIMRGLDGRGFNAPLLTAQATAVEIDVPVTF